MSLPSVIEFQLTDAAGRPASGAFVFIRLKMPKKNDFDLLFGPANASGRILVTQEDLVREGRKDTNFFIMDYADPTQATGEYTAAVATPEDLDRALQGFEKFAPAFPYPAGWQATLREARAATAKLSFPVEVQSVSK